MANLKGVCPKRFPQAYVRIQGDCMDTLTVCFGSTAASQNMYSVYFSWAAPLS